MNQIRRRDYFIILAGIVVILILALGYGIANGDPLLIGLIVIAAILVTSLVYRQIGDVMTDTLTDEISGRAARTAIGLTLIITSIIFASALTFFFAGGWGTGAGSHDDGTVTIRFSQFYPHGHDIYSDSVRITDPANPTGDEIAAVEKLFLDGARIRDGPLFFGLACGFVTTLLAGLYAICTLYYGRRFGV